MIDIKSPLASYRPAGFSVPVAIDGRIQYHVCMLSLIAQLLLSALTLLFVAYLVPGIDIDSIYIALIAAVVLGVLNMLVKPILVILTLPITIVTLGLFIFVINALMFLFAASFIEGFSVDGFIPALVGSLLVSVISLVTKQLVP